MARTRLLATHTAPSSIDRWLLPGHTPAPSHMPLGAHTLHVGCPEQLSQHSMLVIAWSVRRAASMTPSSRHSVPRAPVQAPATAGAHRRRTWPRNRPCTSTVLHAHAASVTNSAAPYAS